MGNRESTRGFITVATGAEQYYIVAANLLLSYRLHTKDPLPFAIIADRENEYTGLFDKVIILDNPQQSYMDKVFMLKHIPFDETMFVEADILVYKDINCFFDAFSSADDFSMFGNNHPLDADITYGLLRENGKSWGWFDPQKMGKYKNLIQSIPQFGSGIVYFKRGPVCDQAWQICDDVWKNAGDYGLKPLDDELFAVAMAATGCKCVPSSPKYNQCIYPHMRDSGWHPEPDLHKGYCHFTRPTTGKPEEAHLCHWGSSNTRKALYQREAKILKCKISNKPYLEKLWYALYAVYIPLYTIGESISAQIKRIKRGILRRIKR